MGLILLSGTTFTVIQQTLPVSAEETLQQQIDRLAAENAANERALTDLSAQATSYQDAIKRLEGEIVMLNGKIADNQAKQASLQEQIRLKQLELEKQKGYLGDILKNMYVKEQITTIEMLATSKDLSAFIDAETYRTSVQNNIQKTLAEITRLQRQLSEQKIQVDQLLAEQRTQQAQLEGVRAEQSRLLALNQAEQAAFNARTAANQNKIDELIAEQARLNSPNIVAELYFLRFPGRPGAFNPNAYPYKNGAFSMRDGPCMDGDGPDQWGYCYRQCVSYAAWAVEASGRSAPRYYGDAKSWVLAAWRDRIPVYTSNPQPGDVAISTGGNWGHAMYVEKVNGNQIYVSQYNAELTGRYSTAWRTYK
jgi:peptidoglycan hydrolase CwlO-like protein